MTDPRGVERRLWEAFRRGVLVDLRVGDPEMDDPARGDPCSRAVCGLRLWPRC